MMKLPIQEPSKVLEKIEKVNLLEDIPLTHKARGFSLTVFTLTVLI